METLTSLLPYVVVTIITGYASFALLRRAQMSAWWLICVILPFGAIIVLWAVVYFQLPSAASDKQTRNLT